MNCNEDYKNTVPAICKVLLDTEGQLTAKPGQPGNKTEMVVLGWWVCVTSTNLSAYTGITSAIQV